MKGGESNRRGNSYRSGLYLQRISNYNNRKITGDIYEPTFPETSCPRRIKILKMPAVNQRGQPPAGLAMQNKETLPHCLLYIQNKTLAGSIVYVNPSAEGCMSTRIGSFYFEEFPKYVYKSLQPSLSLDLPPRDAGSEG